MLQQLYWTIWGASSAQKEQPGMSRKTGEDSRGFGSHRRGGVPKGTPPPCDIDGLDEPYSQVTRSAGRM